MDEERLIELLARKLAGEASPEELEQLGDLITRNPEAIRTYDIINQIWKEKSEEKSSENYFARHRIKYQHLFEISDDNLIEGEARNGKNNKPKYLAGSLIAIVLLFTTAYLFLKAPEVKRLITNTEIISGKGVRKSVTLPDGTTVWINADSRISFDPHMNEREERMVELVGEAYFDVVHIADHPFIIHTSKVSIKVLGTAFNIKAYPDDNKCETTLIRGAIELSTNNSLKQKFTLRP
ncbi:MAG: FecR family protein, partial [Chitinophagaceae bacterium]